MKKDVESLSLDKIDDARIKVIQSFFADSLHSDINPLGDLLVENANNHGIMSMFMQSVGLHGDQLTDLHNFMKENNDVDHKGLKPSDFIKGFQEADSALMHVSIHMGWTDSKKVMRSLQRLWRTPEGDLEEWFTPQDLSRDLYVNGKHISFLDFVIVGDLYDELLSPALFMSNKNSNGFEDWRLVYGMLDDYRAQLNLKFKALEVKFNKRISDEIDHTSGNVTLCGFNDISKRWNDEHKQVTAKLKRVNTFLYRFSQHEETFLRLMDKDSLNVDEAPSGMSGPNQG